MKPKLILSLIGVIIFGIILLKLDISQTFSILMKSKWRYLIFVPIISSISFQIKVFRWRYLMKRAHINYSFWDSFLMYMSGMYAGIITPGRVGDFIKVLYLKRDGHSFGKSFVSVFLDRIFDVCILFFVGYAGLFFFGRIFDKGFIVIFGLILAAVFTILIFNKSLLNFLLKKAFGFFIPEKYKDKVKTSYGDFMHNLKLITFRDYLYVSFLSFLYWVLYFFAIFLLARSISMNISFLNLSLVTAAASLISLLPISLLGIGTRDITFIMLLSQFGIEKESAVALSFMILALLLVSAFTGLFCWFKKPIVR